MTFAALQPFRGLLTRPLVGRVAEQSPRNAGFETRGGGDRQWRILTPTPSRKLRLLADPPHKGEGKGALHRRHAPFPVWPLSKNPSRCGKSGKRAALGFARFTIFMRPIRPPVRRLSSPVDRSHVYPVSAEQVDAR